MRMNELIKKAKEGLGELTTLKLNTVVGASKDEESGGWRVMVELLEKASIPDAMDLLGTYEVLLDEGGEIVGFERKGMRKRGDANIGVEY